MDDFSKFDIATTVTDSLIKTFDMMLSMKLELADEDIASSIEEDHIVGSVSMAGKVKGAVSIQVGDAFSRIMTAAMLGLEVEEIEGTDQVKDVISEMCNIVGGNLKSNFCDIGLTCQLSPPSFTLGRDFEVESLDTSRHERYVFSYENYPIIVEVAVVASDTTGGIEEESPAEIQPIDINTLNDFDIKSVLSESLIDMFDQMLSMELELKGVDLNSQLDSERIVGGMRFAGILMGGFNIYVTESFSQIMTASMLGMEVEEIEGTDQIKDVISEMCNIVGGSLKSKFCDAGLMCQLSTPSYTSGNDFIIESESTMRYERYAFSHQDDVFFVEAGFEIDKDALPEHSKTAQTDREESEPSELSQNDIDSIIAAKTNSGGDQQRGVDSLIAAQAVVEKDQPKSEEPATRDSEPKTSDQKGSNQNSMEGGLTGPNVGLIMDIPLQVTVVLGRTKTKIEDLLRIDNGSVVEFSNPAEEPVDVLVNQTLIARGTIVVEKEKYGVKITETIGGLPGIQGLR